MKYIHSECIFSFLSYTQNLQVGMKLEWLLSQQTNILTIRQQSYTILSQWSSVQHLYLLILGSSPYSRAIYGWHSTSNQRIFSMWEEPEHPGGNLLHRKIMRTAHIQVGTEPGVLEWWVTRSIVLSCPMLTPCPETDTTTYDPPKSSHERLALLRIDRSF